MKRKIVKSIFKEIIMNEDLFPVKLKILHRILTEYVPEKINSTIISEKFGLSMTLSKKYEKVAKWLISRIGQIGKSFEEFKNQLLGVLEKEFCFSSLLRKMASNKYPLNRYFVQLLVKELCEKEIDVNTARALIQWAKELKLVVLLRTIEYTPTEKDFVWAYIYSRGSVPFSVLEKKFPNARTIVLELWKEGRVFIEGIEELGLDPSMITDFDRIPAELVPESSRFISIWLDETTGERYASIIIPPRTKVNVR